MERHCNAFNFRCTQWVKKHLNAYVQDREGGKMQEDRSALLSAVLNHPGLLGRYLAGSEPHANGHHDEVVSCTADLLAQILDCAEAAGGAGSGSISSSWSKVLAASQPYLSR